jgi:hypothetical protein
MVIPLAQASRLSLPSSRAAGCRSGTIAPEPVCDGREDAMTNGNSLSREQLDQRIAILRDNIRQLVEQAAAYSGERDESRNADRIAQQSEELDRLLKQRDALPKR